MTVARSKELPEAYRTVCKEVFDLLRTDVSQPCAIHFVSPLTHSGDIAGDPYNVVMPPPIMPATSCLLQSYSQLLFSASSG